ncbi:MAG TPA: potassium/proton antiporter, partial [Longimicrobiales bacterium]
MFAVDRLLLVGGILLLIGIASSKFSSRVGLPVLVLFLAVGMLAGSEGIGGIEFENYAVAHGIGTIALALILFDGGLRTPFASFRAALAPSLTLATVGVLGTALITGLAASYILGIPLIQGLLLGSIVGSTDAAAVFAVLRSKGLRLPDRLASTLEIESGSNDPMAIFLTVGIIQVIHGRAEPGFELLWLFAVQMSVGAAVGLAIGRGTVFAVNRIDLDAAGLYPVLTAAAAILSYSLAATLGGSGFLSVYLAGIMIANGSIVFRRGISLFHDGAAWLSQITMFVLLGLLSFPSRLADVAGAGLLISAVLILVARPVTVAALLAPFRFTSREVALIAWVGLKGAVPIVLATYPLLLGVPGGELLFDAVFFVVLVSAITQGWSLPFLARLLRLQVPAPPTAPVALEITSLRNVQGDIVEYTITRDTLAAGRLIRDLKLPDGAVVAMIARGEDVIPPRGTTRIEPDDHLFLVLRPDARPLVDRIFSRGRTESPAVPAQIEFPLRGDTTVSDLEEFYGIRMEAAADTTLDELLRERLGDDLVPGAA